MRLRTAVTTTSFVVLFAGLQVDGALATTGGLTPPKPKAPAKKQAKNPTKKWHPVEHEGSGGLTRDDPPTPDATPAPAPAPGEHATLITSGPEKGLARTPESAPAAVKKIIAAANKIAKHPYVWGGGHGRWEDRGYDCSGSVSYALHGAGLLSAPMPSGGFIGWGAPGPGRWVTIYTHSGHMYMTVAGLRFDTSGQRIAGSRWVSEERSTAGFVVRHPSGL